MALTKLAEREAKLAACMDDVVKLKAELLEANRALEESKARTAVLEQRLKDTEERLREMMQDNIFNANGRIEAENRLKSLARL